MQLATLGTALNPLTLPAEAVAPDGNLWKTDDGFEKTLLKAAKGMKVVRKGKEVEVEFRCSTLSHDGRYIVAGSNDGKVHYIDTHNGGRVKDLDLNVIDGIESMEFGPTSLFVGTGGGEVLSVNLTTEKVEKTHEGHDKSKSVNCMAVSKDGKTLISTSDDGRACVWDLAMREEIKAIEEERGLHSVTISPDGTNFCLGGGDYRFGYFQVYDMKDHETLSFRKSHTTRFNCLTYSRDGLKVFSGTNEVKVWDVKSWGVRKTLAGRFGFTARVRCLAESPCEKYLVAGFKDNFIRIFDIVLGIELKSINDHKLEFRGIQYASAGKIVGASASGDIKLWNLKTVGRETSTLKGHSEGVRAVAISANSKTLVSGGYDKKVQVWDPKTRKLKLKLKDHEKYVFSVAASRDGSLVLSGSRDKTTRISNLDGGETKSVRFGNDEHVFAVVFSVDEKTFFAGGQKGLLRQFCVATGKVRGRES